MPEQTQPHTDKLIKAVFFCASAHFLFFIMGLSAKYLSSVHHVAEISFYRNLITFVLMISFFFLTKRMHLLRTKRPKLIAIRSCAGSISGIVLFASLHYLPMAYATVLFYTSSLITPVLAFLFLKENVSLHRWGAVLFGMIGVIIIAQPSGEFSMIGLFFALTTACLHSAAFIMLRSLKTEAPLTITFYFVVSGIIIPGLIFMPWVAKPITPDELGIFLAIGISGGLGQFAIANAYKYAPASFITPIGYTSLLWNVLADIFYWKYDIDMLSVIIGATLILCAQIYMIAREHQKRKEKPTHET
jgi:drug/metabolite transporter (DMT)-like permease